MKRAELSILNNGNDPARHIALTYTRLTKGRDTNFKGRDYYLTRGACYLIAINGESTKPEVAAAQAYFAVQTRRMEEHDARSKDEPKDIKRLLLRGKVSASFKPVSSVAAKAGVRKERQPIFHDQRYKGLYGMGRAALYERKGLKFHEELLDRMGTLELSAHEFQMNLAANVIDREGVTGEQETIDKNLDIAKEVRRAIQDSGATLPEDLSLEEHISSIRKRITGKRTKMHPNSGDNGGSLPLFEHSSRIDEE